MDMMKMPPTRLCVISKHIIPIPSRLEAGAAIASPPHDHAYPSLVFEGHSTDYQQEQSLRMLVEDGVAILKVGPGLTFAMREALFGLAYIDMELSGSSGKPDLIVTVEKAMEYALINSPYLLASDIAAFLENRSGRFIVNREVLSNPEFKK